MCYAFQKQIESLISEWKMNGLLKTIKTNAAVILCVMAHLISHMIGLFSRSCTLVFQVLYYYHLCTSPIVSRSSQLACSNVCFLIPEFAYEPGAPSQWITFHRKFRSGCRASCTPTLYTKVLHTSIDRAKEEEPDMQEIQQALRPAIASGT